MEQRFSVPFEGPSPVTVMVFLGLFLLGVIGWGMHAQAQPGAGSGVAVITLHEVADGYQVPSVVAPAGLEAMIVAARRAGYNFISLPEFHAYMEGRGRVPPRAVLLTFDDGYRGVYLNGHPVLAAQRCPAVMFPVTKWFSPYPRPEMARAHLTVEDARDMLASGLWGFGGHTHDGHRFLPAGFQGRRVYFTTGQAWLAGEFRHETGAEYLARVWADIQLMSLELRRLGIEPVDFAAPYGQMNEDLERLLLEAGYRYLYVEGYRLNYPGQHFVYRVDGGTTADQFLNALRLAGQTPKPPQKIQNRLEN